MHSHAPHKPFKIQGGKSPETTPQLTHLLEMLDGQSTISLPNSRCDQSKCEFQLTASHCETLLKHMHSTLRHVASLAFLKGRVPRSSHARCVAAVATRGQSVAHRGAKHLQAVSGRGCARACASPPQPLYVRQRSPLAVTKICFGKSLSFCAFCALAALFGSGSG
eukprot:6835097-Alexandrium_andersonii.AAC.1